MFSWHYGYACRDNGPLAWIAGYTLAALAGLAKGPQGPVYFVSITTIFLCFRRDWKFLFNRWHLAGLAGFILIIGAWQLPFYLALDATSTQAVWSEGGDFGVRFQYPSVGRALEHWVSYPVEVLVCLLPWSFLLVVRADSLVLAECWRGAPDGDFLADRVRRCVSDLLVARFVAGPIFYVLVSVRGAACGAGDPALLGVAASWLVVRAVGTAIY